MAGKVVEWARNTFGKQDVPDAPTSQDLYRGPAAFSYYRPSDQATGDKEGFGAARTALRQLQGIATRGSTPQGDQQFASYLRQGQAASGAARQAAMQGAQARGQSTGGAGLAASLQGAQGDANAAANAAAQYGANADAQRVAAMGQAAATGAGLDAQAYGQGLQNAQLDQAFNQWATGQQSGAVQQGWSNAMAENQAQRGIIQQLVQGLGGMFGGGS